eukprot:9410466-Alexandrium_andersonii.AAC.1
MSASLVGSEMCIRDRRRAVRAQHSAADVSEAGLRVSELRHLSASVGGAVSYTHLTLPTICSV